MILKFTIVDFYLDWIKMYKISLNVLVCYTRIISVMA